MEPIQPSHSKEDKDVEFALLKAVVYDKKTGNDALDSRIADLEKMTAKMGEFIGLTKILYGMIGVQVMILMFEILTHQIRFP